MGLQSTSNILRQSNTKNGQMSTGSSWKGFDSGEEGQLPTGHLAPPVNGQNCPLCQRRGGSNSASPRALPANSSLLCISLVFPLFFSEEGSEESIYSLIFFLVRRLCGTQKCFSCFLAFFHLSPCC